MACSHGQAIAIRSEGMAYPLRTLLVFHTATLLALAACATTPKPTDVAMGSPKAPPRASSKLDAATRAPSSQAHAPMDDDGPDAETPMEIFHRVQGGLRKCYEDGRKDVPSMLSGRATFEVSIDAAGRAACVVVSEDEGLTQQVEDCMSERIAKEPFKASAQPWATELPVEVDGGKLSLSPPTAGVQAFESVETHGLPASASMVLQGLVADLRSCTIHAGKSSTLRMMHVGARVAKDGHVLCAVASSNSRVPAKMRECAEAVLAAAQFPAPTGDVGLVSVPVEVFRR